MQAEVHAKLFSRILVVTPSRVDHVALRFGLVNKGYRNFSILSDREELAGALERGRPDVVLLSSAFDPAERTALLECIQRGAPGLRNVHLVDPPQRDLMPLLEARARVPRIRSRAIRNPDNIPINVELELTSRCNARCVFCPIDKMERVNQTMSDDVLAGVLATCKGLRPALVYLCGVGEPLLYRGIVEVVREISEEIGCAVGINTNGQLLTPALFTRLLEAGLSMVNISINGTSEQVYRSHMKHLSQEKVHANIEAALAIRPEAVSLQGVITRGNQHELPGLVRYWTEKGVQVFTFNQCSNKSGFLDRHEDLWVGDLGPFFEKLVVEGLDSWVSINSCNFPMIQDDFMCRVPVNFISVDVEGNILHCMHDFASVTQYGKFQGRDPEELRELLRRRVTSRASICEGCNAPQHEINYMIWNGQRVLERNVFEDVAAWEASLTRAAPPARAAALASQPN
jgi:MoaA/NifB/PqqE/SkfB family radical SAM enzyme